MNVDLGKTLDARLGKVKKAKGEAKAEQVKAMNKFLLENELDPSVKAWLAKIGHHARWMLGLEEGPYPGVKDGDELQARIEKGVAYIGQAIAMHRSKNPGVRSEGYRRFRSGVARMQDLGAVQYQPVRDVLLGAPVQWLEMAKVTISVPTSDGDFEVMGHEWDTVRAVLGAMRVFEGSKIVDVRPSE